jgi:hypothetical protein
MYFTPEKLAELNRGHGEVHEKFADVRERYFIRNYGNDRAKEHAFHGFARRLGTLVRCIDRVFEILPPDREDIPSRDEVVDATINIQAFVLNIFGCLDNLAWIWVCEKDVRSEDGSELPPNGSDLTSATSRFVARSRRCSNHIFIAVSHGSLTSRSSATP